MYKPPVRESNEVPVFDEVGGVLGQGRTVRGLALVGEVRQVLRPLVLEGVSKVAAFLASFGNSCGTNTEGEGEIVADSPGDPRRRDAFRTFVQMDELGLE